MEGQKANRQLPIRKEDHREQPARHGGARGGGGSSAGIHPRTIPVEFSYHATAAALRFVNRTKILILLSCKM